MVVGLLVGMAVAAAIDAEQFLKWRLWQQEAPFRWGLAARRWSKGAILGGLIGAWVL